MSEPHVCADNGPHPGAVGRRHLDASEHTDDCTVMCGSDVTGASRCGATGRRTNANNEKESRVDEHLQP